jgi:hypothetical protein
MSYETLQIYAKQLKEKVQTISEQNIKSKEIHDETEHLELESQEINSAPRQSTTLIKTRNKKTKRKTNEFDMEEENQVDSQSPPKKKEIQNKSLNYCHF